MKIFLLSQTERLSCANAGTSQSPQYQITCLISCLDEIPFSLYILNSDIKANNFILVKQAAALLVTLYPGVNPVQGNVNLKTTSYPPLSTSYVAAACFEGTTGGKKNGLQRSTVVDFRRNYFHAASQVDFLKAHK